MDPAGRYEILNTIAAGDFATVHRARDRDLQREVAVKQIHAQFLSDPRQLERYWREAQLLASLPHPNIVTIYDVVRPRGWLILELMRGNLDEANRGRPIDLDYLRVVLVHCLGALRFLHANGVIHGDIKPSNMLVDAQNRIKLGDFGLARRASNQEGSLLKGTTKYMAPELISDQFGPVGPASDLYSLGFSAYELMCGSQFESLFPGLSTFGRDEQIAWLMWHSAADRKLPPIGRVLEGVPDDLVEVIEALVHKDQSHRFPSAEDAMRRLRGSRGGPAPEPPPATAPPAGQPKHAKALRIGAIAALACSLFVSVVMLMPGKPSPEPPAPPKPAEGIVRGVQPRERLFVVEQAEDGSPEEITIHPRDEILINGKKHLLRDLLPGDHVTVEILRNASGRVVRRVVATRPQTDSGRLEAVEAEMGKIVVDLDDGQKPLVVLVPEATKIRFNGEETRNGKPLTLAQLEADDTIEVRHIAGESGRTAVDLGVLRVVVSEGILRDIDASEGRFTLALDGDDSRLLELPLAAKHTITINERSEMGGQLLKLGDLRPGDTAQVSHDTHVVRVDAYRILGQAGEVRQVFAETATLQVLLKGHDQPTNFLIGPGCAITLTGLPASLADLRVGDLVDISHDAPDARSPEAIAVAAIRPRDPRRWAILVATQNYDDRSLSRLSTPVADAQLLERTLTARYGVPQEQILLLADASQVRLEQAIPEWLDKAQPGDQVIVYLAGHAYRDDDGTIFVAPQNFNLARMATSGIGLAWLVDQFEACAAGEKLLLFDGSHAGSGADLKQQPSASEMLESLEGPTGRSPLTTVAAVASSSPGERGRVLPDQKQGLFAYALGAAFSGAADTNRDTHLEPTELFAFLGPTMSRMAQTLQEQQTPRLFLPDSTPPRLSEEAKTAIRRLAVHVRQDRADAVQAKIDYTTAEELAQGELEPKLLFSLLLVKTRQRQEASLVLESLRIEQPELLLPLRTLAWLHFEKRTYERGVEALIELVEAIPPPNDPTALYPESSAELLRFAGRLREFAAAAERAPYRPKEDVFEKLDAAVDAHSPEALRYYREGRDETQRQMTQIDQSMLDANEATQARFRVVRRQLRTYGKFPFESLVDEIVAGLDP